MFVVKINDGFVEWSFTLIGSTKFSIQNLVDAIVEKTGMKIVASFVVRPTATDVDNARTLLSAYKNWQAKSDVENELLTTIRLAHQYLNGVDE